jgi:hypothetical protein
MSVGRTESSIVGIGGRERVYVEFVHPHRVVILPRQEDSLRDVGHELPVSGMLHVVTAARVIGVRLDDGMGRDVVHRQDSDEATLGIPICLGKQGV